MTTVAATVSAINHLDNPVCTRKRGRGLSSDDVHSGLVMAEKMVLKKPKIEPDLGFEEEPPTFGWEEISKGLLRYGYVRKGFGLTEDVIDRVRNQHTTDLVSNQKRLHLVLDLDHTLLNTTFFENMSPAEEYLKTQTQADHGLQHVHVLKTSETQFVTKLRPYVRTFLQQASKLFELSIYTNGSRYYALEMARLLDPANQMFGGRVISTRSDSTDANRKGLDVVIARASAVLILDDKKNVWRDEDRENVIVMKKYNFFRSSCQKYGLSDAQSYSESKTDEFDRFGGAYLAKILKLLKYIHKTFFDGVELHEWESVDRDVRRVLKMAQKLTSLEGL